MPLEPEALELIGRVPPPPAYSPRQPPQVLAELNVGPTGGVRPQEEHVYAEVAEGAHPHQGYADSEPMSVGMEGGNVRRLTV